MSKVVKIHRGCGGVIKNDICTTCKKKWGKLGSVISKDIEEKAARFEERSYRQRIRNGSDLVRED